MTLFRAQGAAEVVVWDSTAELVIAMDFDGRQTRSIGPLTGGNYYSDFTPYIGADTEIYNSCSSSISVLKLLHCYSVAAML
jgi:hypothetical protein